MYLIIGKKLKKINKNIFDNQSISFDFYFLLKFEHGD